MKREIGILLIILSFSLSTKAQNLVYNGYFEISDTASNGFIFASGWNRYATPDYYNIIYGNLPYTNFGYQQDCCGGKAIIGEYMICSFTTAGDDNCREYIETRLIDTLKAGHKYIASMYVNRCNYFNYSITSVGMLFTDTFITLPPYPQFYVINANPQVKSTTLLSDTMNWVHIQDTITAVGNEIYLTIGNFNSTATSDTVQSNGTWTYTGSAYYYIDGVSVIDVATIGIEQNKSNEIEVRVYPNPTQNSLQVTVGNEQIKELKVFDVLGKELLSIKEKEINVSGLQSGVYFIQAKAADKTYTTKFIKE